MRYLVGLVCVSVVIIFASFHQPSAQDGTCPAFVQEALTTMSDRCQGLGRNSVCYGYNSVSAVFNEQRDDLKFNEPSDTADLTLLESIQTAPLDESSGLWGLALMNVQANVPGTLPGQGVKYILMGGANIENQVTGVVSPEPVTVRTNANVNIRSQPSTRASVVTAVPANTELIADLLSRDGEWLRITHNDRIAWINRFVVTTDGNLDALPGVDSTQLSPMQAFRFTTGVGEPACDEAKGALLIQGPNNIVVDIQANGARMKVASTVLLSSTNDNRVRFSVLSGSANIEGKVIPRGFSIYTDYDDEGNFIVDDTSELEPLDYEELESYDVYEYLSDDIMNYELEFDPIYEEWDSFGFDDEDFNFEDFDFDDWALDYGFDFEGDEGEFEDFGGFDFEGGYDDAGGYDYGDDGGDDGGYDDGGSDYGDDGYGDGNSDYGDDGYDDGGYDYGDDGYDDGGYDYGGEGGGDDGGYDDGGYDGGGYDYGGEGGGDEGGYDYGYEP